MRPIVKFIIFSFIGVFVTAHNDSYAESYKIVLLQALDKVTARVFQVRAPIGIAVRFGTLEIVSSSCEKRPPEEPPESAAFLNIAEARLGEEKISVLSGWMFASSPALSALEHPVYDVWVLDCISE
jgi:hypothetical protein